MRDLLLRARLIAGNTFLEAVRQRFFNLLLLLALGFVLGSLVFRSFNFGSSELKFIADFGMGALTLFGSILAIVATAQLFFSEIDNRTALTLLAKPAGKLDLLLGKFGGVSLLLVIFTAVTLALLTVVLGARELQLMANLPPEAARPAPIIYADLLLYGLLQWLKFCVLGALTLFIASFARSNLFTVVMSFMAMIIGQLQYIAQNAYSQGENWLGQAFAGLVSLLFPNLQLFNVGDHLVFADADHLPGLAYGRIAGYALLYCAAYLALALYAFRHREL